MADPPPPYPDSNDDLGDDKGVGLGRGGLTTGTPLWVKVFGIIAIILVLLFVLLHFTGRGLGGH